MLSMPQVMLHHLGQQQAADQCTLQEDQPECFLELATTNDGAYVTINSNAKTASEVGSCVSTCTDTHNIMSRCDVEMSCCVSQGWEADCNCCTNGKVTSHLCSRQVFLGVAHVQQDRCSCMHHRCSSPGQEPCHNVQSHIDIVFLCSCHKGRKHAVLRHCCTTLVPLQVHILSTSNPCSAPQLVQRRIAGLEYFVSHHEGQLVILTNAHGAINYQLMTTSVHERSLPHWRTLVPEREGVALRDMDIFAKHTVLYENHGMQPAVSVLSLPTRQETARLSPQKQVDPTVYANSQGVLQHQQGSSANQQTMQTEVQLTEDEARPPQSQQTCQQRSDPQPFEQRRAQQQQQQQQHYTTPELHQQHGLYNTQQLTQPHLQQQRHSGHDQQLLQSVHAHVQTINIPPWVMSIETGANLDHHSSTVRLKMASPVHPQHVYDYYLDTGQLQLLAVEAAHGHDPADYVCQLHYASSHDGIQVWQLYNLHKQPCGRLI